MKKSLLLLALSTFAAPQAEARYSNACFSKQEVQMMVQKRDVLSKAAADCLKNYWETHEAFFKKNGYSKYFGVRNHALDTPDKRAKALLFILAPGLIPDEVNQQFEQAYYQPQKRDSDGNLVRPGLTDLEKYLKQMNPRLYAAEQQQKQSLRLVERSQEERGKIRGGADLRGNTDALEQNISCVDLSRRCLQEGFKQAGMLDTFAKIDAEVLHHDVSGSELQKGLSDLGWKTLYWNPDPSMNEAWDQEDRCIEPLPDPNPPVCPPGVAPNKCPRKKVWQGSWGGHAEGWASVQRKGVYPLGGEIPLPIDDKRLLVGFRTSVPEQFKKVPYFVGTAHGGYHVFPGFYGNVIEGHSVRPISSEHNMEVGPFNPIGQKYLGKQECAAPDTQADGEGGPRWTDTEHYRSGVIVVPPGYLDNAAASLQNPQVDEQGCVDLKPRH